MKKLLIIIAMAMLWPGFSIAQLYPGFNYQGVVRSGGGAIMGNQPVDVRFSILDAFNGNVLYSETQNMATNGFGLINHVIGAGVTTDTLTQLDWFSGSRYLKVEVDADGGGYKELGTSQIVPVPMALVAEQSMDWRRNGDEAIYQMDKLVGIGTDVPLTKLHIIDSDASLGGTSGGGILLGEINSTNLVIDQNEIMARNNHNISHLMLQAQGGDIRIHSNTGVETSKIRMSDNGNVGLGTESPLTKLHIIDTDASLGGTTGGGILLGEINSTNLVIDQNEIMARNNHNISHLMLQAQGGDIRIHSNTGNVDSQINIKDNGRVGLGVSNPSAKLHVNGDTKTKCLEITGGCDLAEYKQNHDSRSLEPGDVVLIDPTDPKGVLLSDQPYNKMAIGIYSGANGVKPGMILSQEGVLDGDIPVAIAGQVYVKVTGKVNPGDLLTSSNIPGHAMKAKNYKKAFGAIIGKAISTNDENGFALVLIGRQ
ncbi:MAG: hypothetical protein KDE26_03415 [Bacteroidetes bacterium]|nr:hypothetical protein [Bacteroidota bacterium]MCB0842298.1 hypothetical protein [Bacteroidota bacterium]